MIAIMKDIVSQVNVTANRQMSKYKATIAFALKYSRGHSLKRMPLAPLKNKSSRL